jgi:hypothetical protein
MQRIHLRSMSHAVFAQRVSQISVVANRQFPDILAE